MGSAASDKMKPNHEPGVRACGILTGVKSCARGTAPKGPPDPNDVGGMAGFAPSDDHYITSGPNKDHIVTSGTDVIVSG